MLIEDLPRVRRQAVVTNPPRAAKVGPRARVRASRAYFQALGARITQLRKEQA